MAAHSKKSPTKKFRFDKYEVYEHAVQDAFLVMRNLDRTFTRLRGRPARTLREDFCGTGANAAAWIERHPESRAVGIDLDPEPLAWSKKRRFSPGTDASKRVQLINGNVLTQKTGNFDCVIAMNFSWMVFKTREDLLGYFRRVRAALAKDGVFWLDLYGGPETCRKVEDHSRMGPYSYYWEQKSWEAVTGETKCAIHLRMKDGIKRKNVFTYDWRLWTLAETIDVLRDAGFQILEIQDEYSTSVAQGSSAWRPVKKIVNVRSFVANVFAGRSEG